MGRFSIIIYVIIGFLLLLLLVSRSPDISSSHRPRRHRRLKLRSNFTFNPKSDASHHIHIHHDPVPFDPILAELERHREDKVWEKQHMEQSHPELLQLQSPPAPGQEAQPEWEEFMDAEDYLNDEDKFNITNRLVLLFPKIDVDPADGFVTENELTAWNLQQAEREVMHRTQREMDLHDKNHDAHVSFTEYEPPAWVHKSDNHTFGYDMGWWKEEHFNASDADGDGLLNITEFNDFLHPADSKNPKLLQWLCEEEVRERDSDRDGKVSFKEFFHGLFDMIRNYDEENPDSSHPDDSTEAPAKLLFHQLDKDGDGFLTADELLAIIGKLHPSERYYAKQQADYIISQADSNKDGRLTMTEMIENPYVFYSAVFNDDADDDYDYHDEFR